MTESLAIYLILSRTGVCKSRFSLDLPPVFNSNSMPEDEPQGPPYKRRRTGNTANIPEDNDRRKVLHNPTPNEEYKLRDGEEFGILFRGQNVCHGVLRLTWRKKYVPSLSFQNVLLRQLQQPSKSHSPTPSTSRTRQELQQIPE